MSATPESLAQFCELTSASLEQAQFFLDSSDGDVELAISTFFESGGATPATGNAGRPIADDTYMHEDDEDDEDEERDPVPERLPSPAPATTTSWGAGRTLSGALSGSSPSASSPSSSRSATPSSNPLRSNAGPRVATLRDLSAGPAPAPRGGGGEGDDDPTEFFTGGEKSGLSVQNPNTKKKGSDDMIKGILQKAREGGAQIASLGGATPAPQAHSVFRGAAHTLGSDETPSTFIPDPTARPRPSGSTNAPGRFPGIGSDSEEDEFGAAEQEETAIRNLTFWQDGFSIEDGDLMKYEENQEVLAALNSGRAPLSLLKVRHDQPVELRIAKRLDEKWKRQPPPPTGPFAGSGHRLGSEASPAVVAPPPPSSTASIPERPAPNAVFEVDQTQPTTSLQIRLRDGTRMVARFNHTHTVGDVRAYVNASQPGQSAVPYALQTTFPSRELTDNSATLKEANLLGSVIIQRGL